MGEPDAEPITQRRRVIGVRPCDDGVRMRLNDGRAVHLGVAMDPEAAGRVTRTLRRIVGIDLILGCDDAHALVHGVGHHRPTTVSVSVPTAVALTWSGAPTTVTLDPRIRPYQALEELP